jgi:O-acetyl-ADP-ribose deacetylase (regulator of RNase III)
MMGVGDMKAKVNKVTIQLHAGDVYSSGAAAVAVQTNSDLALSDALLARTGPNVLRETTLIGWCDVGSAVITGKGDLPAPIEKVIHVVGPRWGEGSERGKLAGATFECLRLAETNRQKSLALPPISTGTLGYPLENCAKTMIAQVIDYAFEELKHLNRVIFCLDETIAFDIFKRELSSQLNDLKASGEGKVQV